MFCNKCGTQVSDQAAVCPNCGAPIAAAQQQGAAQNAQYTKNAQYTQYSQPTQGQNPAGYQMNGAGFQGTQSAFNNAPMANMNKKFFQQNSASVNLLGLVAAVVGLICTFLAKVTASASYLGYEENVNESIMGHYGVFMISLFILTGILMFMRKDHTALIPAALNTIFCIFKVFQELGGSSDELKELSDWGVSVSVSLNFFFWLMVIAAALTVVAVFVWPKLPVNKNKQPVTM